LPCVVSHPWAKDGATPFFIAAQNGRVDALSLSLLKDSDAPPKGISQISQIFPVMEVETKAFRRFFM
jgi:hypothetical protein